MPATMRLAGMARPYNSFPAFATLSPLTVVEVVVAEGFY